MVSQWHFLGTHLEEKPFCSQQHPSISLMTQVCCLHCLIVGKLDESAIQCQTTNLWFTQETKAAPLPPSPLTALTGGHEFMLSSLLWKGCNAATPKCSPIGAHDSGNISASEEWPWAGAGPHHTSSCVQSESSAAGVLTCISDKPRDKRLL